MTSEHRSPYVGTGEDGARRSARIDREEADGLSLMSERWDELQSSAGRWDDQAYELMLERLGARPSLEQVRDDVGSEEWLAALALLDLSPTVAADVARFAEWSRDSGRWDPPEPHGSQVFSPSTWIDWSAWHADVEGQGRLWSSTEMRLAKIVAALTADDQDGNAVQIPLRGVLDYLGSWEDQAFRILVAWGTGGNNRDRVARMQVVPTQRTHA